MPCSEPLVGVLPARSATTPDWHFRSTKRSGRLQWESDESQSHQTNDAVARSVCIPLPALAGTFYARGFVGWSEETGDHLFCSFASAGRVSFAAGSHPLH